MAVDTALIRDVVVVVPGIMGSELVDRDGRPVWSVAPGRLVAAIRALAAHGLELPPGIGDGAAGDGIRPTRLIDSLHVIPGLWSPVTGYDGLLEFLRSPRFHLVEAEPGNPAVMPNLVAFAYDWRLSNRHNARLLKGVALETLRRWRRQPGMAGAKLVLVCHSMGGLVARWFAEREDGADEIRAIVTIGTPHRGALKALDALVNGLEPGIGPLRLPLTSFARSLPSLYQLLPQYDCLVDASGHRAGLRTQPCPVLERAMLDDALRFHDELLRGAELPYALHKVAGIRQPTWTTGRLDGARLIPELEIDGRNQGGDGTVPRLAAEPLQGHGLEVHEVAGQHGELQAARSLLDLLDGILTREEIVWQAAPPEGIGLAMEEVWPVSTEPRLQVVGMADRRLLATLHDESGAPLGRAQPVPESGELALGRLREGGYRVLVQGRSVLPVAKSFVVLDPGPSAGVR